MLAERLIHSIVTAPVRLPQAATEEALWTLAVTVSGWWLKSRSVEIDELMQRYPSIDFLWGLYNGIRALPGFAATASNALDFADLPEAGKRFAEVLNEVGPDKLRTALGSDFFRSLQSKVLADYPQFSRALLRPSSPSSGSQSPAVSGSPVRAADGVPIVGGRVVAERQTQIQESRAAPAWTASQQTVDLLRNLYPEPTVKRILKA
jgi:hypothetical protein